MGFEVGGFAIHFATASIRTPVPLLAGGAGGAWQAAGRVRAGWVWLRAVGLGAVVRVAGSRAATAVAVAGLCGHVTVRAQLLVAVHRAGQWPVLVQLQQALSDSEQGAVILPRVPRAVVVLLSQPRLGHCPQVHTLFLLGHPAQVGRCGRGF